MFNNSLFEGFIHLEIKEVLGSKIFKFWRTYFQVYYQMERTVWNLHLFMRKRLTFEELTTAL